jgi:hypothetical protein
MMNVVNLEDLLWHWWVNAVIWISKSTEAWAKNADRDKVYTKVVMVTDEMTR